VEQLAQAGKTGLRRNLTERFMTDDGARDNIALAKIEEAIEDIKAGNLISLSMTKTGN
jgi:hypothetical protein